MVCAVREEDLRNRTQKIKIKRQKSFKEEDSPAPSTPTPITTQSHLKMTRSTVVTPINKKGNDIVKNPQSNKITAALFSKFEFKKSPIAGYTKKEKDLIKKVLTYMIPNSRSYIDISDKETQHQYHISYGMLPSIYNQEQLRLKMKAGLTQKIDEKLAK